METLALVLTDVQGSTRLWAEEPDAMDAAMRRHHEIVHDAVAAGGGFRPPDQGEGDAVFAAFASPLAAVDAVTRIQRDLHAEAWPTTRPLRVRIGVHIGEVRVRNGNLFGDPVNRCARIRGLASGGQTLLSAAVVELTRDRLPAGVVLTDLGDHRMKDLTRPEWIHQLDVDGVPHDEFPPLASLDRVRHNLPIHVTPFVGRERELRRVVDLVREHRMVTSVGFGGMGKTRLALQAGAELAAGVDLSVGDVWFVDLTAETDPDVVPARLAEAAGVAYDDDAAAALIAAYRETPALFVVDNLEQVLGCAQFLSDLLARTERVRVLATSREALRIRAEHLAPLEPMAAPATTADVTASALRAYDAVDFFAERARAVKPDFAVTDDNAAAIVAICARLDGHPLALELAAARLRMLSVDALSARLASALKVLTGGSRDMPTRHQTLRATIAWSFDALSLDEQTMLARLSALPAPADLDLIEAVCSDGLDVFSLVEALLDRSMLRNFEPDDTHDETRYGLLVAVREYAAEQLDPAETTRLRDAHADHVAELVKAGAADGTDNAIRVVSHLLPHIRAVLADRRASVDERYVALVVALEDVLVALGFGREMEVEIAIALPRVGRLTDRAGLMLAQLHVIPRPRFLAAARDVYEVAVESRDPLRVAWAATALVIGGAGGGELEDALAAFARDRVLIEGSAGTYLDVVMANSLGFSLQYTDPSRAERVLRTQLAATPGDGALAVCLARTLVDRDRTAEAEAVLDAQLRFESRSWELLADTERSRIALSRGDSAAARDLVTPAYEYVLTAGQFPVFAAAALADVEHADDAPDRVIEVVGQALATSDELGLEPGEALRWRRGRALLEVGDQDAAHADLDAAEQALGADTYRGHLELLGCQAARALLVVDDDPGTARELLDTIAARRGDWVLPHLADRDVATVRGRLDRTA